MKNIFTNCNTFLTKKWLVITFNKMIMIYIHERSVVLQKYCLDEKGYDEANVELK